MRDWGVAYLLVHIATFVCHECASKNVCNKGGRNLQIA